MRIGDIADEIPNLENALYAKWGPLAHDGEQVVNRAFVPPPKVWALGIVRWPEQPDIGPGAAAAIGKLAAGFLGICNDNRVRAEVVEVDRNDCG
jgi:hypothetical protein